MDNVIIPGSAADVVQRQKETRMQQAERQIYEMTDFPELKRNWDALKEEKNALQKF